MCAPGILIVFVMIFTQRKEIVMISRIVVSCAGNVLVTKGKISGEIDENASYSIEGDTLCLTPGEGKKNHLVSQSISFGPNGSCTVRNVTAGGNIQVLSSTIGNVVNSSMRFVSTGSTSSVIDSFRFGNYGPSSGSYTDDGNDAGFSGSMEPRMKEINVDTEVCLQTITTTGSCRLRVDGLACADSMAI